MSLADTVRVLHIVAAAFWAGTMFFSVLFLEPTVRALGADGGRVMQTLMARGFQTVMISTAWFTLLSGAFVFYHRTDGFSANAMRSPYAHSLLFGALCGVLTVIVGTFFSRPAAMKMGAIAARGGPPSDADRAEMGRLRDRLRTAGRTNAALILLALISMSAARYI